jgi:hypothetical protein
LIETYDESRSMRAESLVMYDEQNRRNEGETWQAREQLS